MIKLSQSIYGKDNDFSSNYSLVEVCSRNLLETVSQILILIKISWLDFIQTSHFVTIFI